MFNTKIYGIYIGTCNLKVQIEQQNVHSVVNEINKKINKSVVKVWRLAIKERTPVIFVVLDF